MKKLKTTLLAFLLALSLAACATAGAASPQTSAGSSQTTGVTETATSATTVVTTPAASVEEVLAGNKDTHEDAEDAAYDPADVVTIALNGDTISADGAGVSVEGSTARITAAGTYSLSGILDDGQILVNTEDQQTVRLILNGAELRNSTGAPIFVEKADEVVILLAKGTQNTVSDASVYTFADPAITEPNAAIFSNADLTLSGSGALSVQANYNDGVSSDDGLVISDGNLTVTAVDDGLRGQDYLAIEGGVITVQAGANGLKSDETEDATQGYVVIEAGTVQVTAGGDAIQAETDVAVSGGELNLVSGGGSAQWASGDRSAKGIKGNASVTIDGGTLAIDSADDAIHSNGSIVLNNGSYSLSSGDDGIHADTSLEINGGQVAVAQSYEGIESALITLNGGDVNIISSDDGVNVGGGQDGSGGPGGPGRRGADVFTGSSNYKLIINGGTLVVDANGDGLDSNGVIEMTGGVALVNGPTEQNNGALDAGGFTITGGFLAAVGSSGMAEAPDESSSQYSLLINFTQTQPAGTLVHVQNSAGEDLLTFTSSKPYQSLAFSSPDLVSGGQYTIYTGGSSTGAETNGLYQGGGYTPGSQQESFTVAQVVTTLGVQGRGGPGGWRRP